jgi:hypothetical protein
MHFEGCVVPSGEEKKFVPLPGIEQRYLRYPNYRNNFWICVHSEQEQFFSLCCSVQGSEAGSVMPEDSQTATLRISIQTAFDMIYVTANG